MKRLKINHKNKYPMTVGDTKVIPMIVGKTNIIPMTVDDIEVEWEDNKNTKSSSQKEGTENDII